MRPRACRAVYGRRYNKGPRLIEGARREEGRKERALPSIRFRLTRKWTAQLHQDLPILAVERQTIQRKRWTECQRTQPCMHVSAAASSTSPLRWNGHEAFVSKPPSLRRLRNPARLMLWESDRIFTFGWLALSQVEAQQGSAIPARRLDSYAGTRGRRVSFSSETRSRELPAPRGSISFARSKRGPPSSEGRFQASGDKSSLGGPDVLAKTCCGTFPLRQRIAGAA